MTLWLFNPSEPTGQPTQPGVDYFRSFLDVPAENRAHGRCGHCAACPAMWRMVVPTDLSEVGGEEDGFPFPGQWGEIHGGIYYFRRVPYFNQESALAEQPFCRWYSRFLFDPQPAQLADEKEPHEQDLSNFQWQLGFGLFSGATDLTWWLITPQYGFPNPSAGSIYILDGPAHTFHCLGANKFLYHQAISEDLGGQPFPYRPAYLTLTPHYA